MHGVVKKDLTRLPLRKLRAAVGAGNDPDVNAVVLPRVFERKALGKAGPRKAAVGIDGAEHAHPKPVSCDLQSPAEIVKRPSLVKISAPRRIRLSDQ